MGSLKCSVSVPSLRERIRLSFLRVFVYVFTSRRTLTLALTLAALAAISGKGQTNVPHGLRQTWKSQRFLEWP